MIDREIEINLQRLKEQFPVIALMGPRQSGKTTISRKVFKNYAYVSLEDLDTRSIASTDPHQFLASFDEREGVIIDEIQEVPSLLSYMQGACNCSNKSAYLLLNLFILADY